MRPFSVRLAAMAGLLVLSTFCGVGFQPTGDASTGSVGGDGIAAGAGGSAGVGGTAAGAPSGTGGIASSGGDGPGGRAAPGGAGGEGPCLSCAEAFEQPQAVAPAEVCAGDERDDYIALHDCNCNHVASCESCAAYCATTGPADGSCIDCIDNNAPCDGPGAACGVPNF
ncbi:MAG: hypothetical protein RIF41_23770 [Polyangiaceae bacterium]